jgi:hypothetical protein
MPFDTYWYVENRVIATRCYGDMDEQDVIDNGASVQALARHGTPPVYLICDTRDVTKHPTSLKDMLQGMRSNNHGNNLIVWTVMLSNSRLINFFTSVVATTFRTPMRSCKTIEEAEAFISHHAPELEAAFNARKARTE